MRFSPLFLLVLAFPAHAGSVLWLDAYGGGMLDEDARLSLTETNFMGPTLTASSRFDPQSRPLLGLRLRGEADEFPVGLGLDIGYFRTRSNQGHLNVIPVAFGITLPPRFTLATSARGGRLLPTGMLGIVGTGIDGSVNFGGINSEVNDNTLERPRGRIGLHVSAGLEWRHSPRFAVFTEYRYQLLRFRLEHTNDLIFATQNLQTSGRIESSELVAGVSWRLGHVTPVSTP